MTDDKFRSYSGEELLGASFTKRQWLVENILRERDTMLFVGDEKAGKSLLVQQLVCSLTTEHPFLDRFKVFKTCRITYAQFEGEIEDTQDIFRRLMKSTDFDPKLFHLMFYPAMALEKRDQAMKFIEEIKGFHKPDVLILDPLYLAMAGSLNEDVPVRAFISNLRYIKNVLGCAVILVHHTHKIRLNRDGVTIAEGDEATYGSRFLKAYPDHTMLLAHNKKTGIRILSCATQRKGDITKSLTLALVQPDPLYFEEEAIDKVVIDKDIEALLKQHPNGLTREEIEQKLEISHTTFYKSLKELGEVVVKTTTRPTRYRLKELDSSA